MSRLLFVLTGISLFFWSVVLQAQPAPPTPVPGLAGAKLTPMQLANLVALGQVWGLAKYYHPTLASGQRNADTELFQLLPSVLNCPTMTARSMVLSQWLAALGSVQPCAICATRPTQSVRQLPATDWATDTARFSPALRKQLALLAANPYQGLSYYVGAGNAMSPGFLHEDPYAGQPCPGPELRILALFRYWNMVQYFYPYKYALGTSWAAVLPAFIPTFLAANTALDYRRAALALFTQLHDGHATLVPDAILQAETGKYTVAAALQVIEQQMTVLRVRHDGLVPQPPLEPGDVIVEVEGIAVAELLQQRLTVTPGSNQAAQLRTIATELLRGTTPSVNLLVRRNGQVKRVVVPRFELGTVPPVRPPAADSMYRFLTPQVGYIDMARITKAKIPALMRAFQSTRGIVIDLRSYPGEFVSYVLPGYFLKHPVAFAKVLVYDPTYPGRFLDLPAPVLQPAGQQPYTGQLVVLINEGTFSQAEFTAMALRATPHCLLLGSQTAGADGDVVRITLPGDLMTRMSGTGIYYPDNRETQRVGLVPDVEVRPTLAGVLAGHDELRDQAVELIMRGR